MIYLKDFRRVTPQKGEVGIEIEVEGRNLPPVIPLWRQERDGSLRNGTEFVMKAPIERDKVGHALKYVRNAYKRYDTKVEESPRQSIHVHINVQDMPVNNIFNLIILFLIFERPLVDFCGEERKNNLFCLRSIDAHGLISHLEKSSNADNFTLLNTNDLRYSAVNVSSLFKYGSLEFRSMRGTDDFDLIEQWVDILLHLKDAAMKFPDPTHIINGISMDDSVGFVQDIFGEHSDIILKGDDWEGIMFDSMRELQVLAFTGDWNSFIKKEVEEVAEVIIDEHLMGEAIVRANFDEPVVAVAPPEPPPNFDDPFDDPLDAAVFIENERKRRLERQRELRQQMFGQVVPGEFIGGA